MTGIQVPPSRLARGRWCHRTNGQLGEGDIVASYSADSIALDGRVRKPFVLQGCLWVCVSSGNGSAKVYQLLTEAAFDGPMLTYRERVLDGDKARGDPRGFYHGIVVRCGAQKYVLSGPPVTIVEGAPEPVQADLFGEASP